MYRIKSTKWARRQASVITAEEFLVLNLCSLFPHQVFQKVAEERKGKVHVFFCGSPVLAKMIKAHCELAGFKFYKENF